MRLATVLSVLLVCAGIAAGEAAAAAPANDQFADAVLLAGASGSANGTTVDATSETGEPSHYANGRSVWYRWIAPAAGSVTFETCGSNGSVLDVYTGSAVSGLTAVTSTANWCYPGDRVSFTAAAGTEYRIAVDSYASSPGTFALAWRPTPAPAAERAPSVAGTLRVGEALRVTPGAWSSLASVAVSYQWQRCGNGCSDIPGATGATYTLGSADVGFDLAVAETAANAGGSTTAIAWAGLVEGLAPSAVAVPAFDSTPRAGQAAVAYSGSWAGARPLTYAFQWQRCSHSAGGSGLVNAALQAPVRVSRASASQPAFAVDGNPDSVWTAGVGPRQSIENDLGVPTPVAAVRLHTSQSSAGVTVHRITGRFGFDSSETLLRELAGTTADGNTLEAPLNGEEMVRFVRVETILSPSPVAWREIEVLSRCRDIPGAASERYLPSARDIGSSLRFIVYSSNVDGTTTAVTNETDPVEGCIVPRLAGKTVLAARGALFEAGCRLGRVDRSFSRVRAGRILRQSAAVGARRNWRAPVNIVIRRGPRH